MNKYRETQKDMMKKSFPNVEPKKPRGKNRPNRLTPEQRDKIRAKVKSVEEEARKELKKDIRNKKEVDAVKGGKTSW